jgi:hypothetical protein
MDVKRILNFEFLNFEIFVVFFYSRRTLTKIHGLKRESYFPKCRPKFNKFM